MKNPLRTFQAHAAAARHATPPAPPAAPEPKAAARVPRKALIGAAVVVAAALAWGAWGQWQRSAEASQTQRATQDYVPTVHVGTAKKLDGPVPFTLPGTVAAFEQATIIARATGYVAERRVDIGSRVHKGDLLIRIAAPDLDQELAQANAQLVQMTAAVEASKSQLVAARSSADLARVTNGRTSVLAQQGWETRQNADNTRLGLAGSQANVGASEAGVTVAQANLAAQFATVKRLKELVGYETVTAPFDGVVTTRGVDTGDLVNAGATATLFTLLRDDVVRVAISVPQSGAIGIRDGQDATVKLAELPGQEFKGVVARQSVALSQTSRTLQAEVDVPNADGTLRPGLYVTVDIKIARSAPGVLIPAEALIFNGDGLRVAVVEDGRARMHDVSVYRDYGTAIELRTGLSGGESVILTAPPTLEDGGKVKVQADKPAGKQ